MDRKNTPANRLVLILFLLQITLLTFNLHAQVIVANQGFDSSVNDTWGYVTNLNGGSAATTSSLYASAPYSYQIGGSSANGSNDPNVIFNNIDVSSYTDLQISVAFTSDGSVDNGDDLYLDVSYNNGASYADSFKLLDGKSSSTEENLPFTHAAVGGLTLGSPYVFSVPNGNTQIRVRIRFDENNTSNNTSDYYFIDNITLSGTILGTHMRLFGNDNSITHSAAPTTINATDYSAVQVGSGSLTNTFTIKNVGTSIITLVGAPILTGSADFSLVALPATIIPVGGETTFQILFNPSSIGTKTGTISILSNDSSHNPFVFDISGVGVQNFFDSDGDGVYDDVDIDDDNDGIEDSLEENNCNAVVGNAVNYKFLNETFGNGDRTTINTTYNAITTYCYEDGSTGEPNTPECPDLSTADLNDGKYTVGKEAQTIANWAPDFWHLGGDHTGDPDGRMAMFNASYTPGIFYTASIKGALPDVPIQYSFWVLNLDRTDAPGIATRIRPNVRVEFRDLSNNLITAIDTGDIPPTTAGNLAGDWYNFSANLNLNVSDFNVIFINNNTGGLGNDLALDDVLITQTLCDVDNDGIADLFDLDSDNDGIPDVVEAGLGHLSNGTAKIDVAWLDINGNGMHDGAESLVSLLDSDGDGVPNYLDLDSDNDTIFDVDESKATNINAPVGFINGDGDIDGDGTGDGPESETFRNKDTNSDGLIEGFGDGILDIYDFNPDVYGNLDQGQISAPYYRYTIDTDGDGDPDYMDITSDGTTFDIAGTLYASLDANNDGVIDGSIDVDHDGILDAFDTNNAYFGSPRDLERKLFLEFDGRNDYGQDINVVNGWANATLMTWINIDNAFISEGIIIGQTKLHLKINNSLQLQAVVNNTTLTYPTPLNTAQWIHVGLIYNTDTSTYDLLVNGEIVATTATTGAISGDASLLTIGKDPASDSSYFKGKIDEARLFNIALTEDEYQKMVYQEIEDNGQIRGAIVPKDITSVAWANLVRYYRMDNYKHDIIDDHTTVSIDEGTGAKIYNVKLINVQQAPMPFVTEQSGDFAIACNSLTKQIRGQDANDYDWSIIQVLHDINEPANHTDLGLFVNPGVLINMNNDNKIQNNWYLKLDGKIDLIGRSQLVQTEDSDLDPTSAGSIERDQQGTTNRFNYNYWSSPVGPINASTNNNNYSIASVFRDGTDPDNLMNITWIGGYNSSAGTPISLARFWLYKFQNVTPAYANWVQINENSLLQPGQSYTMKGSNALTPTQNYTFVGKPFNGTITSPIAAGNTNLSGNPYASAIDANVFIMENSASLTGSVYFWEHYPSNNSHNLAAYQGGYAARNLTGGTTPVAPALISGLGSSTRIPGRFIPVGQGFFVEANATGGNITFNNTQRIFIKEDNINSNVMFREATSSSVLNEEDTFEEDTFQKIRLGYTTATNLHRQVLLGFMNQNASDAIDYGYDATIRDEQNDDMSFYNNNMKLVIQGVGYFYQNNEYPIFIKASQQGFVKFMIDGLENFDTNQPIYIYNSVTQTYHDIRTNPYEVEVGMGDNYTQFSLRFQDHTLANNDFESNEILTYFAQDQKNFVIKNFLDDMIVKNVTTYNMLGQNIKNWDVVNENQTEILLNMNSFSSGSYIVKIETTQGELSKKIIIQ